MVTCSLNPGEHTEIDNVRRAGSAKISYFADSKQREVGKRDEAEVSG
jgi:hypothetical protein